MFPFFNFYYNMPKEQENNKDKPKLYTYYGKQYDYNDLKRSSDEGLNAYLDTLRRGERDYEEFMNAYSNMMKGIEDGSITFEDGRFNDSLGRYSNGVYYDNKGQKQTSKRKHKDYYGLVANYIAGNLGKSAEYQTPEDTSKIKWGNNSLSLAFNRRMFNSDNGNIQDFQDLDEYNENTKSRSTDNRISQTKDTIKYLYDNFDSLFTGYSDAESKQAKEYLSSAMTALDDGKVNSGDYLSLSRALGGINWRDMFSTSQDKQPISQEETPVQKFSKWVDEKYPKYRGSLQSRSLNTGRTYNDQEITALQNALSKLQSNDLYKVVRSLLVDRNYVFNNDPVVSTAFQGQSPGFANQYGMYSVLTNLKNRGLLQPFGQDNLNLYFIPNTTTKNNTGWVWNTTDNSIVEMDIRSIPYWQKRLLSEYKNQDSGDFSWAAPYLKEGGIIKADQGTSFSNIYAGGNNPDISYNVYLNKLFSDPKMLEQMKTLYGTDFSSYANAIKGNVDSRYSAGINDFKNNTTYIGNNKVRDFNIGYQNKGNTFNYALFGNSANDYDSKQNGVAYQYTNFVRPDKALSTGDRWDQDASKAYIDNALGLQTYSRIMSLTDPNIRDFGKWGQYWKDNGATGAYYYTANGDTSGKGQWIPTNDSSISGYKPFISLSDINTHQDIVPELNPTLDVQSPHFQQVEETHVDPRDTSRRRKQRGSDDQYRSGRFGDFVAGMAPDLLGLGRLFSSLRTNDRVAETIRKSLNPVLKDTYEKFSPVTGAFDEMQFRNSQAANLRRQASLPFTSDASLHSARQLDANRQAQDLEYQGFLANNREIKRTAAESLARQEDNMARRSEVANFNRASMNQTDREKAELEATRLRRNWQSVDNFLQGLEGRFRTKIDNNLERRNNFRLQTGLSDIEDNYQNYTQNAQNSVQSWMAANPGKPISSMPNYSNYIKYMQEMQRWKQAQQYKTHANVYGYKYNSEWLDKDPNLIGKQYGYKRGGTLTPRAMYLINKIIKNESNT